MAGSEKTGAGTIRVAIVDDHAVVRQGLRAFLTTQSDIKVVGEAANGREALERLPGWQADVVLMDLVMPELDGVETIQRISAEHPGVRVIALTSFAQAEKVIPAVHAGATGYLLKDVSPLELVQAIRAVAAGQSYLHPEATRALMQQVTRTETNPSNESLTQREHEVLRLIASGLSNKEIAARLTISEKTVKTHVGNVLGKLGVADRTQAALEAIRRGLAKL